MDAPAATLGQALTDRDETVAVAESCTGGLISSTITDVPGASAYFELGLVTYAYGTKLKQLAVPRERLDKHGAVSQPVAEAMAQGIRDRAGTRWGLATTGVTGPGDEGDGPSPGTVCIGIAYGAPWGSEDSFRTVDRYTFDGDRRAIKEQITTQALTDLYEQVVDH